MMLSLRWSQLDSSSHQNCWENFFKKLNLRLSKKIFFIPLIDDVIDEAYPLIAFKTLLS